ncbi:ribbon-helix-helix protein, CopG family [Blastococcus sp. CT_GayMR20]|uniref:ribbon-helix-helix protein, CopG family n=1 Tax=Blastococcus sp. CT_GayMR20 TaxID=2559609 RepID=UPI001FD8443B|nr:ribbon-helix-helix protein, CopG family [Blastococcus sp. CT_GayMR20]
MTLRLDADETDALRRRAQAEGTSMQDVARRAVAAYIRTHESDDALRLVIEQQLARFAGAVEWLGRWQD